MQFNNSFNDDDSCQLVAFGLGLKWHNCRWITNGKPCSAPVQGQDASQHLKTAHRTNDTPHLTCQWDDCGDTMTRACIGRHVQEKHLGYLWPCPKCHTVFTRRGNMDAHRAACTAT